MTPDVTDPIHAQVVTGFQQQAAEHQYSVVLANGFWDAETERRALREFAAHRVAAVAVMGTVLPQAEVKRLMAPSPVLFIGSEHVPSRGAALDLARGCLRPDDRDGMKQVVDHLIERGYRTVAYVSGSEGATQIIRRDALIAALADRGRDEPVVHRADDVDAGGLRAVAARIRASTTRRRGLLRRQDRAVPDGRAALRRRASARRRRDRRLRRQPVRPDLEPAANDGVATIR